MEQQTKIIDTPTQAVKAPRRSEKSERSKKSKSWKRIS